MNLTIITPEGPLLQKETDAVTFPGEMGSFTVLKGHAPIIANLLRGEILYGKANGRKESIKIESGFVRVFQDNIDICVELEK